MVAINCINAKHLLQKKENIAINKLPGAHPNDGGNSWSYISLETLLEDYLLKDVEMDSQIREKAKQIRSLRQNLSELRNATADRQEFRHTEADMVNL